MQDAEKPETLWDIEDRKVTDLRLGVPAWIDQDITVGEVAAIEQGGCASGAYMPAVTYHEARSTMDRHGDDVLDYIEDHLGEVPQPKQGESWSGIAVFYLSTAVELWASTRAEEIREQEDLGA